MADILTFTLPVPKVLARSRRVLNRSVELSSLQLLPTGLGNAWLEEYDIKRNDFHANDPHKLSDHGSASPHDAASRALV
jgi:hypothetical protein